MTGWMDSEGWIRPSLDDEQLRQLVTKRCPSCGREFEGFFAQCPSDQMALQVVPTPKGTLGKRFECGAKIGGGSLFDLFEGKDTSEEGGEKLVAVKVLRRELECEQRAHKYFEQEQMIASTLNHESIVTPLAFGVLPEEYVLRPFIVSEFVNGQTLEYGLLTWGLCSCALGARFMYQFLDAVEHAHQMGAIHSDLKPGNVLLTGTAKQPLLKILDFGVSKRMFASKDSTRYGAGASAQSASSAIYTAPEVARGGAPSAQSDVYALGCIFYELLIGHPPFQGTSSFELAFQHERDEPSPLPDSVGTAPLREAILACLTKDPSGRLSKLSELKTTLEVPA